MEKQINIITEKKEQVKNTNENDFLASVILYNDEVHSFEDVIIQLIKALHCSIEKAELLTLEVHTLKKALVFKGDLSKSLMVSGILREINLKTEVRF